MVKIKQVFLLRSPLNFILKLKQKKRPRNYLDKCERRSANAAINFKYCAEMKHCNRQRTLHIPIEID